MIIQRKYNVNQITRDNSGDIESISLYCYSRSASGSMTDSIYITFPAPKLKSLGVSRLEKLLGANIHTKLQSVPMDPKQFNNPFFLTSSTISKRINFMFGENNKLYKKEEYREWTLATTYYNYENGGFPLKDYRSDIFFNLQLQLSSAEYQSVEKLGMDQSFKLSMKIA